MFDQKVKKRNIELNSLKKEIKRLENELENVQKSRDEIIEYIEKRKTKDGKKVYSDESYLKLLKNLSYLNKEIKELEAKRASHKI